MNSFVGLLLVTITVNCFIDTAPVLDPIFVSEDDMSPEEIYSRPYIYRPAMEEGLRPIYNDEDEFNMAETQRNYKRNSGLKFIGLGKKDYTNWAQNGQKKKSSGMKYIGLGKRDSFLSKFNRVPESI